MKNNNLKFILSISLSIVLLDQIIKYLVSKYMGLHQSIPIINNVFHLTSIHITGAGFGILQNGNTFLIFTTLIILGLVFFYFDKILEEKPSHIPVALIIGGAVGNLIDRILLGHVVDFIDFRIWPAFNIADSAITIGVMWLIVVYWNK